MALDSDNILIINFATNDNAWSGLKSFRTTQKRGVKLPMINHNSWFFMANGFASYFTKKILWLCKMPAHTMESR